MDFNFNNKRINLPKCTLAIEEMIENIMETERSYKKREIRVREYVTSEFDFVCDIIGEEKTKEVLNCTGVEDVDTRELTLLIYEILKAYNSKIANKQAEDIKQQMNKYNFADISKAAKNIKDIAAEV